MKDHYLTMLRARDIRRESFRDAAQRLSFLVASDIAATLPTSPCQINTPLGPSKGVHLQGQVVIIPIMRAGLALLPSFMGIFPEAPVGFWGIRRDEKTSLPHLYYENIPPLSDSDHILILDPMLATGGSATLALQRLKEKGGRLTHTTLVTILATPEGMRTVNRTFPEVKIYTVAVDEKLTPDHYIFPGLGDFGDRYFG